jgi:hypothetical protein
LRSKLTELGLLGHATARIYLDDDDEPRQLWPPPRMLGLFD